jgi:hypothetical protein
MRKARKKDILDLLDFFYEKYDLKPSDLQHLVVKGLLELPAYSDLVDVSFVKTNKPEQPMTLILENNSNKSLLMNVNYTKRYPISFEPDAYHSKNPSGIIRIAKESDQDLLKKVVSIIEASYNFKDLINTLSSKITEDQMEELSKHNNNVLFTIMLDVYKAEKTIDLNELTYLKDRIAFNYRAFERDNHLGMVPSVDTRQDCDFEEFKDRFSILISSNFEMFKYSNELDLGLAAVSETEATLMRQSIVNDFFELLAQEHPEYFLSREDGLYEYILDDNELKKHQLSARTYYEDFELFNTEYLLNITASHSLGLDNMPHFEKDTELNSVRFIGDNAFLKEYFVYLEHKKSLNGSDFYTINDFDFLDNISVNVVKGVIEKCFKLAEDSGFLLDIRMRSKFIKTKEDSKFDVAGYFNELIHEHPKAKIINTRDENQEISVFSHSVLMEPIEQTHQTLNAVKKRQAAVGNKIKQKI